jgi:hypothetical protein
MNCQSAALAPLGKKSLYFAHVSDADHRIGRLIGRRVIQETWSPPLWRRRASIFTMRDRAPLTKRLTFKPEHRVDEGERVRAMAASVSRRHGRGECKTRLENAAEHRLTAGCGGARWLTVRNVESDCRRPHAARPATTTHDSADRIVIQSRVTHRQGGQPAVKICSPFAFLRKKFCFYSRPRNELLRGDPSRPCCRAFRSVVQRMSNNGLRYRAHRAPIAGPRPAAVGRTLAKN